MAGSHWRPAQPFAQPLSPPCHIRAQLPREWQLRGSEWLIPHHSPLWEIRPSCGQPGWDKRSFVDKTSSCFAHTMPLKDERLGVGKHRPLGQPFPVDIALGISDQPGCRMLKRGQVGCPGRSRGLAIGLFIHLTSIYRVLARPRARYAGL